MAWRAHAANVALPPSLLIYGARDHIVEPKYGETLADALRARGARVAYLEIPWAVSFSMRDR
ncbi:MAG TPA: hypothetical protein VN717_06325 [Gemmatimonadaceae bacterium]|nr:hypothetical protein [Gemmatimonadaceae bacterium]